MKRFLVVGLVAVSGLLLGTNPSPAHGPGGVGASAFFPSREVGRFPGAAVVRTHVPHRGFFPGRSFFPGRAFAPVYIPRQSFFAAPVYSYQQPVVVPGQQFFPSLAPSFAPVDPCPVTPTGGAQLQLFFSTGSRY